MTIEEIAGRRVQVQHATKLVPAIQQWLEDTQWTEIFDVARAFLEASKEKKKMRLQSAFSQGSAMDVDAIAEAKELYILSDGSD